MKLNLFVAALLFVAAFSQVDARGYCPIQEIEPEAVILSIVFTRTKINSPKMLQR
jgi:hypothetical protein